MDVQYIAIQQLGSSHNTEVIEYLDKVLNHDVNNKVWDWEFNTLKNTVFTMAKDDALIIGTQSMLPLELCIGDKVVNTAKSETSYLDGNYRGKKIFEQLYQLAIDEIHKRGSLLIWGFTPAIKAWRNNLKFMTYEDEMLIAEGLVGYYPLRTNAWKSRNMLFAIGKYALINARSFRNKMKLNSILKSRNDITVSESLRDKNDITKLYSEIRGGQKDTITLQMSPEYIQWRMDANPVMVYSKKYFYVQDRLVAMTIYAITDGKLILSDLTFSADDTVLKHVLKHLIKNNKCHSIQYWGNKSHPLNQSIFSVLNSIGAASHTDTSRCFVFKNLDESNSYTMPTELSKWYINGLWTEGFHI